ncbi:MAG: hypothetical protein WD512_11590 [Candidatus Paceibacterota bacterium]
MSYKADKENIKNLAKNIIKYCEDTVHGYENLRGDNLSISDLPTFYERKDLKEKEKIQFKSGVKGSKIPHFELIPRIALIRLAKRFELGQERHKEGCWNALQNNQVLEDKEWAIARCAHIIDHATKMIEKIAGLREDNTDDDAGAIMWGGAFLAAFEEWNKRNE